jgi:hypothetical protein
MLILEKGGYSGIRLEHDWFFNSLSTMASCHVARENQRLVFAGEGAGLTALGIPST